VLAKSSFIRPCAPTLRKEPPRGLGWYHEVKFDGFRIQIHKEGSIVALFSKNGHDFTSHLFSKYARFA
jgi:bifunctional non-homologous end joining protein LigD